MKRIGILSDTHGYYDQKFARIFDACDEIWHAGDFGTIEVAEQLSHLKPLKGVYGNIDGREIRIHFPEYLFFELEGFKILILHIGGYPGKYSTRAFELIKKYQPGIFVYGHSHILKVMKDSRTGMLTINPGAAGKYGLHKVRTVMRMTLDKGSITDMEVIELGNRGDAVLA